jgi:hypothetical protein
MRVGAFVALALLGACAFGSERELFTTSDGVQPFEHGARWVWSESEDSGNRFDLVFERDANGRYTIAPTSGQDPIPGVLFVPITGTPEEDYVVQVRLNAENDGAVYAFLWRTDAGYRLVVDPGRLTEDDDLSAADPYCAWQTYQSCGISRREDVFAVYQALIHARFVVGGEAPESYVDLLPPGAAAAPPPSKDRK